MSQEDPRDLALKTVMLALEQDPALAASEGAVGFLRARPHPALRSLEHRLQCVQDLKPVANSLEAAGLKNRESLSGECSLVLLLPDRQREQTLGDLALGMKMLREGGALVVGLHNDWGARRFEGHLAELAGEVASLSKNHCRAFWARRHSKLNIALLEDWLQQAAPRRVVEGKFWSKPGLFSWDEVDGGSQLLADHLPRNIHGKVADLGAAWGYLSQVLLRCNPAIEGLDLFEADRSALRCAEKNLAELTDVSAEVQFHWADVTSGVGSERYDWVVMNPPFHEGRLSDPLLGIQFIAAAGLALKPGGELWMVANRHLPYERHLEEAFAQMEILIQAGGFKVIRARRGQHFPLAR